MGEFKVTSRILGILAVLQIVLYSSVGAQTYQVLHNFQGGNDGKQSLSDVVVSGNSIYGTTLFGGDSSLTNGPGTVFTVKTDGTGYSVLHRFISRSTDGASPWGGLTLVGSNLFGTTEVGNAGILGTVFTLTTSGSSFNTLHRFAGAEGANPAGDLIASGSTLFGLAGNGGESSSGTLYNLSTDGTGFANLHSFDGTAGGQYPYGKPTLVGSTIYGITAQGGSPANQSIGTIFSCNSDGSNFHVIHSFNVPFPQGYHPSDQGGLALIGSTLYGTASEGGNDAQDGTLFAIDTDGSNFRILHTFARGTDGSSPQAGLVVRGNTLYGDTAYGGAFGDGSIYQINSDGTGYSTLFSFNGSNGANPYDSLNFDGSTFYGTTSAGGTAGDGVVFALTVPEPAASKFFLTLGTFAALGRKRRM